jgi:hypothetical protein
MIPPTPLMMALVRHMKARVAGFNLWPKKFRFSGAEAPSNDAALESSNGRSRSDAPSESQQHIVIGTIPVPCPSQASGEPVVAMVEVDLASTRLAGGGTV